jgi:hypothetical protein
MEFKLQTLRVVKDEAGQGSMGNKSAGLYGFRRK